MPMKSAIRIGGKCFQESHYLAFGHEVLRLARSDPKVVKAGKIPFSMEEPLYIIFSASAEFSSSRTSFEQALRKSLENRSFLHSFFYRIARTSSFLHQRAAPTREPVEIH